MNELLNVAIQAAEAGGDKVYGIKKGGAENQKSKGKTAEGVDDPITMGDTLSHEAIVGTIKKAYGDSIFIYSEEKESHNLDLEGIKEPTYDLGSKVGKYLTGSDDLVPKEDVTIWVDPLDATKEYTENLQKVRGKLNIFGVVFMLKIGGNSCTGMCVEIENPC